ncbi:hypothetical protein GCM10010121_063970 [Streptomyces brasiliensis]|uniref:Uncharacterized protein n=1 Tax=Streptomyces brasiliensis TaxID=1954 RepID=A0A917L642_9ACTN|nr:hypothetical protein GCM10010121_063970 [Streptomyces brasiliensis]
MSFAGRDATAAAPGVRTAVDFHTREAYRLQAGTFSARTAATTTAVCRQTNPRAPLHSAPALAAPACTTRACPAAAARTRETRARPGVARTGPNNPPTTTAPHNSGPDGANTRCGRLSTPAEANTGKTAGANRTTPATSALSARAAAHPPVDSPQSTENAR